MIEGDTPSWDHLQPDLLSSALSWEQCIWCSQGRVSGGWVLQPYITGSSAEHHWGPGVMVDMGTCGGSGTREEFSASSSR